MMESPKTKIGRPRQIYTGPTENPYVPRRAARLTARLAVDLTPDRRRGGAAQPRCATGCGPTCRGSTARACRRASTTSPRRSRSAASGRASWPRAAGSASPGPRSTAGAAPGAVEHFIVIEELARARAPELVGRIGINLVGPTLLAHGTPEQKQRWLAEILPARRAVVPAVQRARRRQRPRRRVATSGRAHRRRLDPQRPEGLDELRAVRRLGPVPRPHQPRRAQAAGHLRLRSSTCASPGVEVRPAAPDHRRGRVQRGVLRRRVRPRRPADRPGRRGLARRQLDADPRAGRQPAPARDPHPAARGAAAARARGAGAFDDPRLRAAARAGRRRGAAVPAAQLAHAVAASPRASRPAPRAAR